MRRRQYDVSGLLILIFCVDVYMGLDPPVHMRPPELDPLHVDVINGWPLTSILHTIFDGVLDMLDRV